MALRKAHDVHDRERTEDIHIDENVDFESMYLSEHVLSGLKASGFDKPSPIQLAAIPLGRCGLDMIVQAKSGTGKTCVFTVVALEMVSVTGFTTQVLVLTPTREIAVQVTQVINSIGCKIQGLRASTFIGGMHLSLDRAKLQCCHIAVGTPGRITQLIDMGLLRLDNIRLLVLDEADQLLAGQFADGIANIASGLPLNKQVIALSATYTDDVAKVAEGLMRSPNHVRLGKDSPALIGVDQYVKLLPCHSQPHHRQQAKFVELMNILCKVTFNQCLVFSNSQLRAESVRNKLRAAGWPVSFLTGGQTQRDRLIALDDLCSYKCRVLVSTDLSARGLDSEHVNLVINLDMPRDHATYLHRVGRAGRFGSRGSAISLATEGEEWLQMRAIASTANVRICILKSELTADIRNDSENKEYVELMTEEEFAQYTLISGAYKPDEGKKAKSKKKTNCQQSVLNESRSRRKTDYEQEDKISGDSSESDTDEDLRNDIILSKNIQNIRINPRDSTMYSRVSKLKKLEQERKFQEDHAKEIARNSMKVLDVLKRVNPEKSSSSVCFDNIMTEVSEKYDNISANDNPSIHMPNFPDVLEISETEEKALIAHWKTVEKDLQEVILNTDESWRDLSFTFENVLQSRIEGKEAALFLESADKREGGEQFPPTKLINGDFQNNPETEISSCTFFEQKSKCKGERAANVPCRREDTRISSKCKQKNTEDTTYDVTRGTSSKRRKSKSKRRISKDDSIHRRSYSNVNPRANYEEYGNIEELNNYTYGSETIPDNQMDDDCYASTTHFNNMHNGFQYQNSDVNYEEYVRASLSRYQKYLDNIEKFTGMMDYVHTMGRVSSWIARDYHLNP